MTVAGFPLVSQRTMGTITRDQNCVSDHSRKNCDRTSIHDMKAKIMTSINSTSHAFHSALYIGCEFGQKQLSWNRTN